MQILCWNMRKLVKRVFPLEIAFFARFSKLVWYETSGNTSFVVFYLSFPCFVLSSVFLVIYLGNWAIGLNVLKFKFCWNCYSLHAFWDIFCRKGKKRTLIAFFVRKFDYVKCFGTCPGRSKCHIFFFHFRIFRSVFDDFQCFCCYICNSELCKS